MQKKNILLVGCGNLGSRHLQGLAKITPALEISVVEPNDDAINLGKKRLNEIQNHNHVVTWYKDINNISKPSDLAIISTNSLGRVNLITKLLENNHSRFLVEKMVCQSKEEFEKLLNNLKNNNAQGWLDASRRYFPFYQKMKDHFSNSVPIHFSVKAGNIGLGTNAIHFIDLFLWYAGTTNLSLNGDSLHNEIFPNKHGKDFVEFAGTIIGKTDNDSILELSFLPEDNLPIIIEITQNKKRLVVDETNEKVLVSENLPNNIPFKWIYQSDLTTDMASDIITKDDCNLPQLSDSFNAHIELFRIFNNHLNKVLNQNLKLCPIT